MPIPSPALRGVDLLRSADLALCGFVPFLRFIVLRREVDRPPREEPAHFFAELLWLLLAYTVIVRRVAWSWRGRSPADARAASRAARTPPRRSARHAGRSPPQTISEARAPRRR